MCAVIQAYTAYTPAPQFIRREGGKEGGDCFCARRGSGGAGGEDGGAGEDGDFYGCGGVVVEGETDVLVWRDGLADKGGGGGGGGVETEEAWGWLEGERVGSRMGGRRRRGERGRKGGRKGRLGRHTRPGHLGANLKRRVERACF